MSSQLVRVDLSESATIVLGNVHTKFKVHKLPIFGHLPAFDHVKNCGKIHPDRVHFHGRLSAAFPVPGIPVATTCDPGRVFTTLSAFRSFYR